MSGKVGMEEGFFGKSSQWEILLLWTENFVPDQTLLERTSTKKVGVGLWWDFCTASVVLAIQVGLLLLLIFLLNSIGLLRLENFIPQLCIWESRSLRCLSGLFACGLFALSMSRHQSKWQRFLQPEVKFWESLGWVDYADLPSEVIQALLKQRELCDPCGGRKEHPKGPWPQGSSVCTWKPFPFLSSTPEGPVLQSCLARTLQCCLWFQQLLLRAVSGYPHCWWPRLQSPAIGHKYHRRDKGCQSHGGNKVWKVFGGGADHSLFPVIQGFSVLKWIHLRPMLSVFCLDISNSF